MLSLVPLTFFVVVVFVVRYSQPACSWRGSFLSASILWGVLATAITEFLSLFRLIVPWAVSGLWALSLVLAIISLFRVARSGRRASGQLSLAGAPRIEISFLAAVALIIATAGIIAWISPPNNFDAMTYHMSRVAHWVQNRSVADYPTNILRQLHQNPWAEFAILQFEILSGGDRFANLIQWFSMVGTVVALTLLARQLGSSVSGQIYAAVVGVTIPMGILQGSTPQNDYVVSFWLACFVYYGMLLKANGSYLYALPTGASLGLAILTKATAYIYAFPFMAWIGISLFKSRQLKGLELVILTSAIALSINTGHYARNYDLYGSPLGPGQEAESFGYANDIFTFSSVTSNIIRNIGLHIGTPSSRVNAVLENTIIQLHSLIGIDANDARTTWGSTAFLVLGPSYSEDYDGNPLHLILIAICTPILLFRNRMRQDPAFYVACLLGGFVLFSSYLRWQPWNSRLHLPLFVLWSPVVGLLLSKVRARIVADVIVGVMILGAMPWLVHRLSRPIIRKDGIRIADRTEQYFSNRLSLYGPYRDAAEFLGNSKCLDIGLITGGDDWEYPFWVMLREESGTSVRIEHVNVSNVSGAKYDEYPFNTFNPCAVIVLSSDPPNEIRVGHATYLREEFSKPVSVFMRD